MSLEGHNHFTMVKSLGVFLTSFIDTIHREKPDWVILAGDRGEQLMGAIAAAYTYTPVAHIQAGERSGNIDGVARHAIGKFVHLHLAANQDAADRLCKLGEEPFRIHNVGAPQLDELVACVLPERKALLHELGIHLDAPYLLVVQHPVTEEMDLAADQVTQLIAALQKFDMRKIWILPNNDAGSHAVRRELLLARGIDTYIFDNLTRSTYLGLLKHCKAIVGNSSSGLLEAPTYETPAVNIGRRQADRVRGINVIDVPFNSDAIEQAIKHAISPEFRAKLNGMANPYGDGRSAARILDVLRTTAIDDQLLIKKLTY
ncbi:GDP/UDP-N,N'-diacetylbacillosamine 2-epimerase (hydrolysing) [Paludibacterium purpuratum]|uniref:GDP/UDP-N,N'-diacetylbacillosamine 2-epimerase (Hydrolysing) n=2 Tax=Paludibacterium purpuratum TaxID=1144873 RepID=A0A4R7B1G0_9NEIS|nr:GDP/UDP-N,N'-diacetylbacillosamine 2-epimerase (hydrolysing) [Paludibacterium purpuratum]